jgi:hypothetical protein
LPNALNKLTHTHKKIRVHSEKRKSFKLYLEGSQVEWWMMHPFSCESPSLELNFVTHPLTSFVAISQE